MVLWEACCKTCEFFLRGSKQLLTAWWALGWQDEGLQWFEEYLRQLVTARAKENYSNLVESAGARTGCDKAPAQPGHALVSFCRVSRAVACIVARAC